MMAHHPTRLVSGCLLALAASSALAQPTPTPLLQIEPVLIDDSTQTSDRPIAQGLRPYYINTTIDPYLDNRGTGLDGSLRSTAPFGWAVNANPFAHEWNEKARYREDFLLNNGRYSPTHIDLALPAPGFSWTVGRTYSVPGDAPNYNTSYSGPEGYQGLDWHQFSQPEIQFSSEGTDTYIYLVYGADRYLEFKLVDGSSTVYRGVNGTAGAIVEGVAGESDEFDTLTYWDRQGTRSVFFDPRDSDNLVVVVNPDQTTDSYEARGQLWTITDAAGNQAYVGDDTSAYSAIIIGYDEGARIQEAYDTAGRQYKYTYTDTQGTGSSSSLSAVLLTKVEVFEDYDSNTTWETTGSKVEYTYFTDEVSKQGIFGNLQEIHIQSPLTGYDPDYPTQGVVTTKQRFWYETLTSDDDKGYLVAYVNPEGYRRFELQESGSIASRQYHAADLIRYREFFVSSRYSSYYDSSTSVGVHGRVELVQWPGEPIDGTPSSSNLSNINFSYYLYSTFSNTAGTYDPEHRFYTTVDETGGREVHLYFDEAGQPLSERVEASGSYPAASTQVYPDMWIYVDREDPSGTNSFDGMIWKIGWPSSLASANPNPGGGSYLPPCTFKSTPSSGDNGGLVQVYDRDDSTTSAFRGFMLADQWQHGNSPQDTADGPHPTYSYTYLTPVRDSAAAVDVGGYLVIDPMLSAFKRHPGIDYGSGAPASEDTTYSYEFHAEDVGGGGTTDPTDPLWLHARKIVTTLPSVSTSQLGSGSSETTEAYYRPDGTMVFYQAEDGIWGYTEHDRLLEVKSIQDVDLSITSAFASGDAPANYMSSVPSTTGAYHLVSECVRDELGRKTQTTLPTGRVQEAYYSALASGELTAVWSAKTSGSTHTGPAMYSAYDHMGNQIVDAEIAFSEGPTTAALSTWIDDTATTPLVDAVDVGDISRADTVLMDASGSLVFAERRYHEMPSSGIGTRFINFDERWHEYDGGRRIRGTAEMNGTIHTWEFDPYGNADRTTLNSYQPSLGYGISGVDPVEPGQTLPNYCPEICCVEYIAFPTSLHSFDWFVKGCDDSLALTGSVTLGASTSGQSFGQLDILGRRSFTVTPHAPFEYREFDNLGRLTAVATYKDTPDSWEEVAELPDQKNPDNPDIFTDFDHRDFSPTTLASNRTGLTVYEYTPRGQLYKTTTYAVNQSTGTLGDSIVTVHAYDEAGRLIYSDAAQMTKRSYNRIGDLTDLYVVAVNDDTAGSYADLRDADGDVVVMEQHAAIDPETGNTHMVVRVDREPDISGQPQPVDALDGSDYTDVSTMFVDASMLQGRVQIATYTYDDLDRATGRAMHGTGDTDNNNDFDPDSPPSGAIEISLTYGDDGRIVEVEDELGRVQTRSYDLAGKITQTIDNYVASGSGNDENRKSEWEYRDTQLYKYHAYLDDTAPQTTTYSYGSPHSDPNLPGGVNYNPTNDYLRSITYPDGGVEEFYYNNYGSLSYHIDRHENGFEILFDVSHRPKMVRLVDAGPDYTADQSKSIEITYTNRGRINSIIETDTHSTGYDPFSTVSLEYDEWGALSKIIQTDDWLGDSSRGGSAVEDRAVGYVWESSASSGPSGLRLGSFLSESDYNSTNQTWDFDSTLGFNYTGGTNSGLSRVTSMSFNGVTVADYEYLGLDRVSRIDYPQNDVYSNFQNSSNSFDALDRFNRVIRSRWNKTRTSNEVPFYDNQVHWDDGSNVTGITDHVHTGDWNFTFVNDDLDRLTQAKRGAGSGTVISTLREQEDWTLGKVGTWESHALDLNGDLNYSDSGEFQRDNSFDGTTPDLGINQLETIEEDTDNTAGYENTYNRSYDAHGNVTDAPDRNQEYVWDYLNRLIEVKADDGGTTRTVAEFRYNALGYRIAERLDSNGDGFLDKPSGAGGNGDDTVWRRLIYDARWRVVEVYEVETASGSQAETLAERFVHHGAGLDGVGTGSYIDEIVLRDRDADVDGTLDERHYYCQNWRADVVAIIDDGGDQVEQARYSAYGTPYAIPFADQNLDGVITYFDVSLIQSRVNSGAYDVRADQNLDGVLNFFDVSAFTPQYNALTGNVYGRDVQSAYGHEPGYAGYWRVDELALSHVRNRWYDPSTGGWLAKDPVGYISGSNLFEYVASSPITFADPAGLYDIPFNPDAGWDGTLKYTGPSQEESEQWYRDLPKNMAITGGGLIVIAASPEIVTVVGVRRGVSWVLRKAIQAVRGDKKKETTDILVTQWGTPPAAPGKIQPRTWVMIGGKNPRNYILSFKWMPMKNQFARFKNCHSARVPPESLKPPNDPSPILNKIGEWMRQRFYDP